MELNLETRRSGEVAVIHCRGRMIYREEAAAVSRVVDEALRDCDEVILDFAGVHGVDSAGLGWLVAAHKAAEKRGKTLKMAGASRSVRELFELTNLSSVFGIYPNLAAAIEDGCIFAV